MGFYTHCGNTPNFQSNHFVRHHKVLHSFLSKNEKNVAGLVLRAKQFSVHSNLPKILYFTFMAIILFVGA